MATAATVQQRLINLWETPHTLHGELSTVDHKKLGKRYIVTALVFLVIGGIEALLVRLQLSRADNALFTPEMYDQIFTMHGITMIWWYASPILSGFSIYLIPLMSGSRDLAFPRLNAFTYWTFLLSGILLYISPFLGQAPHGGWFAYTPYTSRPFSPGYGMDFYNLALILLTISTEGGAINFIVSILRQRAPGMSIAKMPLMFYSTLTMSLIIIPSLPALTAANIALELERRFGFHFFDAAHGGYPLLWQQLFWFFGHPWVYIVFLPATGMMSMVIPVMCRRPIVGYPYVATATILTGLAGFGVWMHHMFAVGGGHLTMSFFSAASMTISIFTAVQVFCWLATMWKGKPVMTTAMHFAVGFIVLLVVGGMNGIMTAIVPVDWQITDTYWVVSHLHYVLVGANMMPVFAALYYWVPKMTGRMMSEKLGKISFWVIFTGFNLAFFPMHLLGLDGMPRRIYTYPAATGWTAYNMAITVGAFMLAVGILLTFINFFWSLKHGEVAGKNPWGADTLEWSTESPPPAYGSVHLPTVVTRHPLWDEHEEEHDPTGERILDEGRLTFVTTPLDADLEAITEMPEDTILPLVAALGFFFICLTIIFHWLWWTMGLVVVTLFTVGVWLWPKGHEGLEEA